MLDAYRDLIDELLDTPSAVRSTVEAQSGDAIKPEAKGLVASLRDRDRAVLVRVQTMTRQEAPYLNALTVEEIAPDMPWPELLAEVETARGDLVSILINLSLKDWERRAMHQTSGEVSLADEIEEHVEFDEQQRRRLQELIS